MDLKIKIEFIKAERVKRVWTQQHLADVAGLSLRTIQRIESTGSSGAESIKAIAAAFDIEADALLSDETDLERENTNRWYNHINLKSKPAAIFLSILIMAAMPLVFLNSNYAVGNVDTFRFEGGIRINDSQPHNFGIDLRSDRIFILDVDSRHKLIMEITGNEAASKEAKIRLLQNDGTSFKVLHSSVRPGPDNHLHTVSYRVCEEKVIYYGPSVENIPDCNESPTNTNSD